MKNRHKMYTETIEYINQKEKSGEILVIRPDFALNVKRTERSPENLKKAYESGREAALTRIEEIKSFLED
jgi:predicted patatin/cPLA2 family phospholipase